MANKDQMKVLMRGVDFWNRWRRENPRRVPDLSRANLQGLSLQGANLQFADLQDAKFRRTNLQRADLTTANLKKADFWGANLQFADLNSANLMGANLQRANLTNANCQIADLTGANLRKANLQNVDLQGANLESAILMNTNLLSTNLTNAKFRGIYIYNKDLSLLPKWTREKYGDTFYVLGIPVLPFVENPILRSIEFPPEYHQAGVSILNYFGTVLRQKYPEKKVKVRIEQEELKVTMIVETEEGDRETFDKALDEYVLVMTGRIPIQEYTEDRLLQVDLQNQIINARAQIEMQKNLLAYRDEQIKKQDLQIEYLQSLMGRALLRPVEITIPVTSISSATASPQITTYNQFSLLDDRLDNLWMQLPLDSKEAKSIEEIQESLKEITTATSPDQVKKSPAMSKLKGFLEGVEKTGSKTGKILKGVCDGVKAAQDLAEVYNSIAQWCGLPQVPKPFLKKP